MEDFNNYMLWYYPFISRENAFTITHDVKSSEITPACLQRVMNS